MFGLFASIVVGEVRGEAVGVMGVLRLGQALEECAHDVELRSARHGTTEDSGCATTPAASAVPTRVSSPGSGVSSKGTLRREQGAGRVGFVGRAVAFVVARAWATFSSPAVSAELVGSRCCRSDAGQPLPEWG